MGNPLVSIVKKIYLGEQRIQALKKSVESFSVSSVSDIVEEIPRENEKKLTNRELQLIQYYFLPPKYIL